MPWERIEGDRAGSHAATVEMCSYRCEHCRDVDFMAIGYGPGRQLHLYCLRCEQMTCMHTGPCAAQVQVWALPQHDPLEDVPYPCDPEEVD